MLWRKREGRGAALEFTYSAVTLHLTSLGLPLGLEAPAMTPNSVFFLFFFTSDMKCCSALRGGRWGGKGEAGGKGSLHFGMLRSQCIPTPVKE